MVHLTQFNVEGAIFLTPFDLFFQLLSNSIWKDSLIQTKRITFELYNSGHAGIGRDGAEEEKDFESWFSMCQDAASFCDTNDYTLLSWIRCFFRQVRQKSENDITKNIIKMTMT